MNPGPTMRRTRLTLVLEQSPRVLVDHGYRVVGVDLSAAMLSLARRRVPEAEFIHGSFFDVELPGCAAMTSIGECLNYMFDPTGSLDQVGELFNRAYAALHPGGVLVFDLLEPAYLEHADPEPRRFDGDGWSTTVELQVNSQDRAFVRHITSCRELSGSVRKTIEAHPVRLYYRSDIVDKLRHAGFQVQVVDGYGAFALGAGHVGYVASKLR